MENFHHSGKEEEKILAKLYALTKMMISWMILYKVQHYTFYLTFCGWKRAYTWWEKSLAKKITNCAFIPGLYNLWQPGSRAVRKWRENKEMKRKWRKNEEIVRK